MQLDSPYEGYSPFVHEVDGQKYVISVVDFDFPVPPTPKNDLLKHANINKRLFVRASVTEIRKSIGLGRTDSWKLPNVPDIVMATKDNIPADKPSLVLVERPPNRHHFDSFHDEQNLVEAVLHMPIQFFGTEIHKDVKQSELPRQTYHYDRYVLYLDDGISFLDRMVNAEVDENAENIEYLDTVQHLLKKMGSDELDEYKLLENRETIEKIMDLNMARKELGFEPLEEGT